MKRGVTPLFASALAIFFTVLASGCTNSNVPDVSGDYSTASLSQTSKSAGTVDGTSAVITEVDSPGTDGKGAGDVLSGEDHSGKFAALPTLNVKEDEIPILYENGSKTLFYMKRTGRKMFDPYKKKEYTVIKGETSVLVDVYRLDTATGDQRTILQGVPFITVAKLNPPGDKAAFCGYNQLSIYDLKQNRVLLKDELGNDVVQYFGWSPDGNTIYTEHPNLPNGSILHLKESKLEHAYENDETLYFKGILDKSRFIGTNRLLIDDQKQKDSGGTLEEYKTVVTDSSGKSLAEFPGGRFRDSYGNSLLQAGMENFALYLFPDISKPDSKIKLTEEYVYDAKYITGGYVAFITKSANVEVNKFVLTICNPLGKAVAAAEVSGSGLSVSPDGKSGFINGPSNEQVHFAPMVSSGGKSGISPKKSSSGKISEDQQDQEDIYTALRGAMDIYFRNEMLGEEDYEQLGKYYTNSKNPEQCALTDMKNNFDLKDRGHYADYYSLDLNLAALSIKGDRASATISGSCYNSFGSGVGMGHALELIKKEETWFVTGFSTFPNSSQAKKVQALLPGFIKDLQSGKLFKGELKGKEINAGQIQFWQLSEPHLAQQASYANYCKVYLKVSGPESEQLYKLVLDRKNYKNWTPTILDKERLGYLF